MKKIALLIIDMQKDFILPDRPSTVKGALSTVPKIKTVLNFFRNKNFPIFHIRREYLPDGSNVEIVRKKDFEKGIKYCVKGTEGAEFIEELKPIDGEYIITKPRFSAFFKTPLDLMLKDLKITHVVICGTQYPNCIRCTAFDAISYGFYAIVLTDATSAQSDEIAENNITDMRNIGIECIKLHEFLEKYGK